MDYKYLGQYYTPNKIVNLVLDNVGYAGSNVLKKHIIDNSAGDGAFLSEIVRRYIENFDGSKPELKKDLETYIHGIEISRQEYDICINKLNEIVKSNGLDKINWDIERGDALGFDKYNGKMDYVVGNPPYVRIHNLTRNLKGFKFASDGMSDLYLAFYEVGLAMLNETGKLSYISPASITTSYAASALRDHIINENLLHSIIDFGHYNPFDATVYVNVVTLTKSNETKFFKYDGEEVSFVELFTDNEFVVDNNRGISNYWILGNKEQISFIKEIYNSNRSKKFSVKNGFATLADDFFIDNELTGDYVIDVVKASTGNKSKCIYPYDKNGKLIPYEELIKNKKISSRYGENIEKFAGRASHCDDWYGFGRSQGVIDTYVNKISCNVLIKDIDDIKLVECPAGVGVYSGLYIITKKSKDEIFKILKDNNFIDYVRLLKKYKNGGYYTFSSKDMEIFFNWACRLNKS